MTIPEAAQLVLQAGALAESGSIYVLDMGEPVKIMDLSLIHIYSANAMAAVLIFLFIGGSRLAWRLFLNHPLGERLRGNTSNCLLYTSRCV